MKTICDDLGVKFKFNFDVENVEIKDYKIESVSSSNSKFSTEIVICSVDYNFLSKKYYQKNISLTLTVIGKVEQCHPLVYFSTWEFLRKLKI